MSCVSGARGSEERQLPTARKGTNGVSTSGVTAISRFCDRGTFGVIPVTFFYIPQGARGCLFPQSFNK